jgi:polyvinyl alcohol dehydrogenase (cytochrome)
MVARAYGCLGVIAALLMRGQAYAWTPDVVPANGTPAGDVVLTDRTTAAPLPAVLQPEKNNCANAAGAVALGTAQWNGWGRDIDNTRYQPEPAIRASDVAKLTLKWAYGYQGGVEYGQPTVVDGRVFVSSSAGRLYSLDSKTGCTYWTYDVPTGGRTAVTIGELARARIASLPRKLKRTLAHLDVIKAPSAVFFGDDHGAVYAIDAQKGTLLWKTQVDLHPYARIAAAPTLYNDRLYVSVASTEENAAANPNYRCCTFRGSVVALDIANGRTVWKSFTVLEEPVPTLTNAAGVQEFGPAGAAISSAPTIDGKRNVVYVATSGSANGIEQALADAVVAFDLLDGKLRWVKQLVRTDAVAVSGFTSSPVLRTLASGNQIILAAQQSGVVYGLDPDHGGEVLWQTKVAGDGAAGGIAWGAAADHRSLYVALSGALALPVNTSGSLTALDMKTGALRWHTVAPEPACSWAERKCSHAQQQAVSVIPGSAFSGSLDGHLRAYSTIDGRILWDFDTVKEYHAQNGIKASGGALDHGGATIVNGILFVNSGNALLAFSVDGK